MSNHNICLHHETRKISFFFFFFFFKQSSYLDFYADQFCLHIANMIFLVNAQIITSAHSQLSDTSKFQGPVVQSVVSLTSLLRVISLTDLAFAEKM